MNQILNIIVIITIITFSSCGNKNVQYINKIKHGMTTQQVVSIMGKPDHVQIETLIDSIEFSYYYENAIIAAGNAVVAFKHDSTVAFANSGCE